MNSQAELDDFLLRVETVLTFFRDRKGGAFTTLDEVYERELTAIGGKRSERRAVAHA